MIRNVKHDNYIQQLSYLKLREKYLKRELDNKFYDQNERTRLFSELTKVKKDIRLTKFKLNLKEEMYNEKSR